MYTESTGYWRSRGYVVTMGRLNHTNVLIADAEAERQKLGPAENWDGYKHGGLAALDDYIRAARSSARQAA